MMNNKIAQDFNQIRQEGLPTFVGGDNVGAIMTNTKIIDLILFASAFLLLIYMLLGGLQLMTSRGDPKGIAMAWAKITNALIGFIIVFMAYFLTSIIGQMFGITGFGGVVR